MFLFLILCALIVGIVIIFRTGTSKVSNQGNYMESELDYYGVLNDEASFGDSDAISEMNDAYGDDWNLMF